MFSPNAAEQDACECDITESRYADYQEAWSWHGTDIASRPCTVPVVALVFDN